MIGLQDCVGVEAAVGEGTVMAISLLDLMFCIWACLTYLISMHLKSQCKLIL